MTADTTATGARDIATATTTAQPRDAGARAVPGDSLDAHATVDRSVAIDSDGDESDDDDDNDNDRDDEKPPTRRLLLAAFRGDLDRVRALLQRGGRHSVHTTSKLGRTALSFAASSGSVACVAELLRRGAAVDAPSRAGKTPLAFATSAAVAAELIKHGAVVDAPDKYERTPLRHASDANRADVVRELLRHGAAPDTQDRFNSRPLYLAAVQNFPEVVQALLAHGADPNKTLQFGKTILIKVADSGHVDVASLLLEYGAVVDARADSKSTALSVAVEKHHTRLVELLLQHGADIEGRNYFGATPLTEAASSGFADIVALLLHRGAAVDARNMFGETPLICAAQRGHADIVVQLLRLGARAEAHQHMGGNALARAATCGRVSVVTALLKHGVPVDVENGSGRTPLSFGAEFGNLDVVTELLKNGADVNARDVSGKTPLLYAATKNSSLSVAAELIKYGADVNSSDAYGNTPLMEAPHSWSKADMHDLLLASGATFDAKNKDGRTALLYAARRGCLAIVQTHIGLGADVNARDADGRSPLSHAANFGTVDVVNELVQHGAVISERDNKGKTPLRYTLRMGKDGTAKTLLEHSAFASRTHSKETLDCFVAAVMGASGTLKTLVANGVAVDTTTDDGRTLLMFASEFGRSGIVEFLLERGAAVNVKAKSRRSQREGDTALLLAALSGSAKIVEMLLSAGARVNVRSDEGAGETPLIAAARHGYFGWVPQLMARGGAVRMDDVGESEYPLLPGTLATMRAMCARGSGSTFEFASVCTHVVERLDSVCALLQQGRPAQDTLVAFADLVTRMCRLLFDIRQRKRALERFTATRAVLSALQRFHSEVDRFEQTLGHAPQSATTDDDTTSDRSWRARWTNDEAQLLTDMEQSLASDDALLDQLVSVKEQQDAAHLLQYELAAHGPDMSAAAIAAYERVLRRFVRASRLDAAPVVPSWFVSRADVTYYKWNVVRKGEGYLHTYFEGEWQNTCVTIEEGDFAQFERDAAQWFALRHPHVATLFGACSTGYLELFVLERMAGERYLGSYLSHKLSRSDDSRVAVAGDGDDGAQRRALAWPCLLGAARGLQYLHSQGVIHGDLRSENILVGPDGHVKLCGLRLLTHHRACRERSWAYWAAPETARDKTTMSTKSDVFALGMCIWEALMRDVPGAADSVAPSQPAGMSDAEWALVSRMCAIDASDRIDIGAVVAELEAFVAMAATQ